MFLCLWHPKKSFCQHAGNCVNSSVLARLGLQNTVNTEIFARRGSKPRKYRGFALVRSQKHWYLRCFFVPRRWTMAKTPPIWRFLGFAKNVHLTILGGLQKVPSTKIATATTTGPRSNSYNHNNNNSNDDADDDDGADDDEDDYNDDNKDNDNGNDNTNKNKNENEKEDQKQQQQRRQQRQRRRRQWRWRQRRCSSQHVMSASSDEIPLSLSLPRPLQASPVCEALQYIYECVLKHTHIHTSIWWYLDIYARIYGKPVFVNLFHDLWEKKHWSHAIQTYPNSASGYPVCVGTARTTRPGKHRKTYGTWMKMAHL